VKNNQYDKEGNYKFPEIETKIQNLIVSEETFYELYFKYLEIPQRYLRVFLFILKNKDLEGRADPIRLRLQNIPPKKYLECLYEMVKVKFDKTYNFEGEPLIIKTGKGTYKPNPYFQFDPRKPKNFILDIKHIPT
jgi:hypothetical protein